MTLIVGNLLIDSDAQSFISAEDAEAYLTAEAAGAPAGSGVGAWLAASEGIKDATLTSASRWLASSLQWRCFDLSDADLLRVGHVAARLAVQAMTVDLWSADAIGKAAKRYKAGSVEIEYQGAQRVRAAQAGGKAFPWIYPMLSGLLRSGNTTFLARA